MTDSYYAAISESELEAFCASCANVIGPFPGRAAMPEQTLEDGTIVPAQAAAGEAGLFYVCVRAVVSPLVSGNIALCENATGEAVCGVWS